MFVPRWLALSLMVAAATVGGWLLHGFATNGFSLAPAEAQSDVPPSTTPPLNLSVDGGDPKPVINLTFANQGGGGGSLGRLAIQRQGGQAGQSGRSGGSSSTGLSGSAAGSPTVYLASQPGSPDWASSESDDESYVSNDSRITVNGNNIVVASDGSIVFQGDNGSLNGNTGNSSSGGTIAIDNEGSSISTDSDRGNQVVAAPDENEPEDDESDDVDGAGETTVASPLSAAPRSSSSDLSARQNNTSLGKAKTNTTLAGATSNARSTAIEGDVHAPTPSAQPMAMAAARAPAPGAPASSLRPATKAQSAANLRAAAEVHTKATPAGGGLSGGAALLNIPGRSISISGYEDHSITVDGNDQIILYDDSNVFINRDGQVNANTGDTDSSGLNVVDAVDSVVRAGNSGDGEGNSEDDAEEDEDPDEAAPIPVARATPGTTRPASTKLNALSRGSGIRPSTRLAAAGHGSVDDEDTATTADGDDVLVIGGDGYDDLAIRSTGNRNTVVYDDSNLVIGGVGGVNAQIGDSDTGGAVVMGVRNSFIEAGCEGDLCPLYDSGYHAIEGATRPTSS